MGDITFTQYLRPHGQPKTVWIDRPPEIVALADQLVTAGYHFDIEELRTGEVSMTVEANQPTDDDDVVLAHELCPNGPEVPATVDRLIRTAAAKLPEASPPVVS
jgi:hypothetical protein